MINLCLLLALSKYFMVLKNRFLDQKINFQFTSQNKFLKDLNYYFFI